MKMIQTPPRGLTVYLVDDSEGIRQRIAGLVEAIPGVSVVGEAGTPDAAASGILECTPDVVLLDFQLEGGTGLDVLKVVHPLQPRIIFIVLTNHAIPAYERACRRLGASHFLDKSRDLGDLLQIISEMAA